MLSYCIRRLKYMESWLWSQTEITTEPSSYVRSSSYEVIMLHVLFRSWHSKIFKKKKRINLFVLFPMLLCLNLVTSLIFLVLDLNINFLCLEGTRKLQPGLQVWMFFYPASERHLGETTTATKKTVLVFPIIQIQEVRGLLAVTPI